MCNFDHDLTGFGAGDSAGLPISLRAAQAKPGLASRVGKSLSRRRRKKARSTIYISGYEEVLPDFEKEYPEIKVAADHGPRHSGRPTSARRAARAKNFLPMS